MSGCDRCGHRKKDHAFPAEAKPGQPFAGEKHLLCIVWTGARMCLCPNYVKPGTFGAGKPR